MFRKEVSYKVPFVLLLLLSALSAWGVDRDIDNRPVVLAIIHDGISPRERLPLVSYLTSRLSHKVKLVTPNSYDEVIAGLTDGSIDFACVDGVTYVLARAKAGVIPLVQRSSDLQFHSVFITGAETSIRSLSDLKGKTFAFGDPHSSSGHVIPYLELKRAGLNPEKDLVFRYSGSHPLTMKLVETGIVDAGAVDESVFASMVESGKIEGEKVRIFYRSKPFVDHVWVTRNDVPDAMRNKFIHAFLDLQEGNDDELLRVLRATKFLTANDNEYHSIREAVHELNLF